MRDATRNFTALRTTSSRCTKESKPEAERGNWSCCEKNEIDLIVLARYMQVLSWDFIRRYPQQIINIHHSFLPAFIGAKPHQQAYDRGVKLLARRRTT